MLDGLPSLELPAIQTLAKYKQWVLWRLEQVKDKFTKVPYRWDHRKAATTRSQDWETYTRVVEAKVKHDGIGYSGVGFVLSRDAGNGIMAVDLDHCRDPKTGTLEDEAAEIVAKFNSYTEVSPSGTGIRIFCLGHLPEGAPNRTSKTTWPSGVIEIYDDQRYMTVTGDHVDGWPTEIMPAEAAIGWLTDKIVNSRLAPASRANGHSFNGHAVSADSASRPQKTKASPVDDRLEEALEPFARPDAIADPKLIAALSANSKRFEETWKHERADSKDWSGSEYDLALASFMTAAHWRPVDIMNALIEHRRAFGYALKLERNPKCYYYAHTIRRARQNQKAEEAQDFIRLAASASDDEPVDRESLLEALGAVYNCEITGVVRYSGDQPTYAIETPRGDVRGTIDMLMSQLMLRKSFADVVNVVIPKTTAGNHDKRVQAMLDIARQVEVGPDSRFGQLLTSWAVEYIATQNLRGKNGVNEADPNAPFMTDDGKFVISATAFAKWLREQRGQSVAVPVLAKELKRLGCSSEGFEVSVGGRKLRRSMWVMSPRVMG